MGVPAVTVVACNTGFAQVGFPPSLVLHVTSTTTRSATVEWYIACYADNPANPNGYDTYLDAKTVTVKLPYAVKMATMKAKKGTHFDECHMNTSYKIASSTMKATTKIWYSNK
jgi:hypothetical protein